MDGSSKSPDVVGQAKRFLSARRTSHQNAGKAYHKGFAPVGRDAEIIDSGRSTALPLMVFMLSS
jgi:hypothetical protein